MTLTEKQSWTSSAEDGTQVVAELYSVGSSLPSSELDFMALIANLMRMDAGLRAKVAKEMLQELEGKEVEEEWPKVGDTYYVVHTDGDIGWFTNTGSPYDLSFIASGNVWPSREEAEKYAGRLRSMKLKWKPEMGEKYFTWLPLSGVYEHQFRGDPDAQRYYLGRTFKTRSEAAAHMNEFHKYWE